MLNRQNVIDIINMNRLVKKEKEWEEQKLKHDDLYGYIEAVSNMNDGENFTELHAVKDIAYEAVEFATNEQIINAIVALGIEVTE